MSEHLREMAANALAATVVRLMDGDPETQDEWDAFAYEVALTEDRLLHDPEFLAGPSDD